MRKYLTWLETGVNGEGPTATPAGAATTKGPGTGRTEGLDPAKTQRAPVKPLRTPPTPVPPTRKPHAKKSKRRRSALHGPSIKKAARAADQFDVELVPAVLPRREYTPAPARGGGLSRRDWVFLGIGGAAVIAAGLVGYLIHLYNDDEDDAEE
jgi:hypothetical protein